MGDFYTYVNVYAIMIGLDNCTPEFWLRTGDDKNQTGSDLRKMMMLWRLNLLIKGKKKYPLRQQGGYLKKKNFHCCLYKWDKPPVGNKKNLYMKGIFGS